MNGWRTARAAMTSALVLTAGGAMAGPAASAPGIDSPGRVTGVGGIFFKSKDPGALRAWYRDVLGLTIEPWGGAMLKYDAPGHPPMLTWTPFRSTTDYLAPSARDFMIDLAVDDIDALAAKLKAKGVAVLKREDDPNGRFAWILDPDGTKIELWEPKRP
jgi:predicted enzyme related to lactoylglutathione lyase